MTSQNEALMWAGLPQHVLTVWSVVTECSHLKLQSSGTWHHIYIYTMVDGYYAMEEHNCLHCWHVLHIVPTDFWNMIIPDYQTTNHQGTLKTEGWGSSCTLVFIYQRGPLSQHSNMLRTGQSRDQIPVGVRFSTSHPDHPWDPLSSYRIDTGLLTGRYSGKSMALPHPPPNLMPRLKKEYTYMSTPSLGLHGLS